MNPSFYKIIPYDKSRRIVCISDIHGSLTLLKMLLKTVRDSDYLVFCGDYIEKGVENADTLDYLMGLSGRRDTYFVKGNSDNMGNWLTERATDGEAYDYITKVRPRNLLTEWCEKSDILITAQSFPQIRKKIRRIYAAQLDFLNNLPAVMNIGDYLFVHGGIPDGPDWQSADKKHCIRNDSFLSSGNNQTGKWIIAGHWPTYNLTESGASNNPVIFKDRKTVGIDGGCGTKDFSQINAFVINGGGFDFRFADLSPIGRIVADYNPENSALFKDKWPDFYIQILKRGPYFSLVETTGEKARGYLKNEHIEEYVPERFKFKYSSTSMYLPVRKDEKVYILDPNCAGYTYVKSMRGMLGWVPKEILRQN